MHYYNIFAGEFSAWIVVGNRFVVPFFDGAQKDPGQGFAAEFEITRSTRNVVSRNYGTHHGWEMKRPNLQLTNLLVRHRHIRCTEIDCARSELLDACPGTDRLIVD